MVREPAVFFDSRVPLTATTYGLSVVTMISYSAFSSGVSSQGNQLGAPLGCEATSAPFSSSSQPRVPHGVRMGRGVPA